LNFILARIVLNTYLALTPVALNARNRVSIVFNHDKDVDLVHNRAHSRHTDWVCKTNNGVKQLDRFMKNNYTNTAQLKELMTAPPMTAEQHAAINRKRIKDRRMIEEAKEQKTEDDVDQLEAP
jgi:hypothetical protein